MKLYFALSYSPFSEMKQADAWGVKKILLSYYVLSKVFKEEQVGNKLQILNVGYDFFLDSGAFSSFTKGYKIDIDNYISFIKKTKNINVYAGLDVIGDWKKTRENVEYMESKGLKPLPTFHYNSPLEELDRMCNKYDYIALGGLVPLALQKKKMQNWLDKCFNIIKLRCKVHGFGVNSIWSWKRYPFYSVDATSWNQGSKYGRVIRPEKLNLKQITKKYHPELFMQCKVKDWKYRTELNIYAFLHSEKQITALWKLRGIEWQD